MQQSIYSAIKGSHSLMQVRDADRTSAHNGRNNNIFVLKHLQMRNESDNVGLTQTELVPLGARKSSLLINSRL